MNLIDMRKRYSEEYVALRNAPRPPRGARNLVLGLAANLGRRSIEIFVNSLRRAGYADDIVLFVTKLDDDTRRFCQANAVTLRRSAAAFLTVLHPTLVRYALYYDFLTSQLAAGVLYDRVFLSDTTDVAFQEDPFVGAPEDRLTAFFETDVTIAECPANSGWVRAAFGEAEYEKLKDCTVSCSGTTMGPVADILEYCIKMMLAATNAAPNALTLHGIDQGVHNYLVHNDWLKGAAHSANGEIVLTLHYYLAKGHTIHFDAAGLICDDTGRRIPVIHQYNRARELISIYQRMFAAPTVSAFAVAAE